MNHYLGVLLILQLSLADCLSAQVNQAKPATSTVTPAKTTSAHNGTLTEKTDSLKMAMNDLKTSFKTLFDKKSDTVYILIADIEYDDPSLTLLKENIKKEKGVKSIRVNFKSSAVAIGIDFKGKPGELWDNLPITIRQPFKILEIDDHSIKLKYKNAAVTGQ